MTETQARKLAQANRHYAARRIRGNWVVWDSWADHIVEFDIQTEGLEPKSGE